MDELGFTENEKDKVGLIDGKYQQTLLQKINSNPKMEPIRASTASWRLEEAVSKNNFENVSVILYFSHS